MVETSLRRCDDDTCSVFPPPGVDHVPYRRRGAGGGTRTPTGFRPPGPKPGAYSNSATPARFVLRSAARSRARLYGPPAVAEWTTEEGLHLHHPNREKASSKMTKAIVVLLILVSIALMLIVTIGGWSKLEGAKPVQIGYMLVYALLAFYIARWTRG